MPKPRPSVSQSDAAKAAAVALDSVPKPPPQPEERTCANCGAAFQLKGEARFAHCRSGLPTPVSADDRRAGTRWPVVALDGTDFCVDLWRARK